MKIIDFQEVKEKNETKKQSELKREMRNEIIMSHLYVDLKQYEVAIKKLKTIYNKYKTKCDDKINYIDLYRLLGESYQKINDIELSKKYFEKMKKLIDEFENALFNTSPHTYVLCLSNYYRRRRQDLNKAEKIKINKKIYNCAVENNFSKEIILSDLTIKILEEKFAEAIDSLGYLHKNNKGFILEIIKEELKDYKIEIYEKIELDNIDYKQISNIIEKIKYIE